MNPQTIYKIQQLLDRYYGGETTSQEEAELQALLQENVKLPEILQADAELFLQMRGISNLATQQAEEEAMAHLPEGFEERLQQTIDRLAAPGIQIQPRQKRNLLWVRTAAACASFVVVIGAAIGYLASSEQFVDPFTDTCSTTAQAEFQLNRALSLVNTFSQAGLSEARIETQEQSSVSIPGSKFISFD